MAVRTLPCTVGIISFDVEHMTIYCDNLLVEKIFVVSPVFDFAGVGVSRPTF